MVPFYGTIAIMPRTRLILLLLILLLSACAPQATPNPAGFQTALSAQAQAATSEVATAQAAAVTTLLALTPSPMPTSTPTLAPTLTPTIPTPTSTPVVPPRTQYTLVVNFNYSQRTAEVTEEIQYHNTSGDALSELLLTVELQSFPGTAFQLESLTWAEDGQPVQKPTWEGIQLHVPLRQPLLPGQQVGLKLAYRFALPAQGTLSDERPYPIGYTARQANLVDWYPFIPPYQSGKGWMAYPPSYYGEHLVYDLADFDIQLQVSDGPNSLLIAASAPGVKTRAGWHYQRQAARTFAISMGSEYQVQTAQVGNITISSYYFPVHLLAGQQALKTTVEAVQLYEKLFGPYPHDSLAVVEADFLDGMEYDGLYFLSRAFYNLYQGVTADYLTAIAAHETAHQWWFGIVASDQANQPWLDEALCTYAERIYFEKLYPEDLDWWWAYRIRYEGPAGWVNSSVYSPPGRLQSYRDYRNAVYLNGALFLEDLRTAMGDAAFFAFLKDYTTRYAGQVANTSDFFTTLKRHSNVDIQPLLKQYFAHPEAP